jgi:hypothetical protein
MRVEIPDYDDRSDCLRAQRPEQHRRRKQMPGSKRARDTVTR